MLARLDVLVVALSVAGGSMLIENSHRLDTGAPDEEIVAASTCDPVGADQYDWKPLTRPTDDDGDAAASAPSGCASD